MLIAITRGVSPTMAQCELTHLPRQPIDLDQAIAQHHAYEECLAALGCEVQRLPAEADLPDSVFVEDTALVLDEVAVITRPGAISRRPETEAVTAALISYRPLRYLEAPGTLDGGDVLRLGRRLFVGQSSRSNEAGIAQLGQLVAPFGYTVHGVTIQDCLHLKTAVTQVAPDTLLVNRAWVDPAVFGPWRLIDVALAEPFAANALLVNDTVVYPTTYTLTRRRLQEAGLPVTGVDVSELLKAEGAVTCCSLLFEA